MKRSVQSVLWAVVQNPKALRLVGVVAAVLLVGSFSRVLPHSSNFTPIFALTIAAGYFFGRGRSWMAAVLAIAAMVAGDLVIGLHPTMPFVYASMALAAWVGARAEVWLERAPGVAATAGLAAVVSFFASAAFFVITNGGVWATGVLYPYTWQGLVDCFVMAVPFYRNSLTADVLFGTVFLTTAARMGFSLKSALQTSTPSVSAANERA